MFLPALLVSASLFVSVLGDNWQTPPPYPEEPDLRGQRAAATIYSKCKNSKQVALTFDDGPYIYASEIKSAFAAYNAKATFFVNGNNWRCGYDDDMIANMRSLFAAGHEFGSHTWQHMNLSATGWDKVHDQMWKTEQMLIRVLGVNPALARPPYGAYNSTTVAAFGARNQSMILWDFDSGDSTGSTAAQSQALYKSASDRKVANLLALNHEVYATTVRNVIPYALQTLNATGYKFVTVSQCLGIQPYQWQQAQGVKDSTWVC